MTPLCCPGLDIPAESVRYLVTCPHPSGRDESEYGLNAWWCDTLDAARQQAGITPGAVIRCQRTLHWVPPGKRKARVRHEWREVE
jgi:hypothetical protein